MTVTWLGQAGLLIRTDRACIVIDPYLSDSVASVNPKNTRRIPVDPSFFDSAPDIMIFTHDHLDHYDPETVGEFMKRAAKPITILAPASVWPRVRTFGGSHNYVLFNRNTEWTESGIRFTAVRAEHSDPAAIGVLITEEFTGKTAYITGDTLYNREIFLDLPEKLDVLFLPINGVGNNMNAADASRFAAWCTADKAVPLHFGLFDNLTPEAFVHPGRVIPTIYEEIPL